MSDVCVCVVRGVINVNQFEVRLLPSSHLKNVKFNCNALKSFALHLLLEGTIYLYT